MLMKMTWQLCRFVTWALLPLPCSPLTAVKFFFFFFTAMAANFTDLHICSTKLVLSNNIDNYHVSCAYSAFMHISGMAACQRHLCFIYVHIYASFMLHLCLYIYAFGIYVCHLHARRYTICQ